jgi:hypothetical protein
VRRTYLWAFLACLAMGLVWAAASPAFSGPDEGSHALRAYSAGRGEVVGPDGTEIPGIIGIPTRVEVPRTLGDLPGAITCYAFQANVPAACASDPDVGSGTGTYTDTAGRTPPLYHLLVSPPLELWPRLRGLYAARALGAAVFAAFAAGAFTVLLRRRLHTALVGGFLACTPMAWFFAGVLNPSGLEIAAGVATWAAGIAVLHDWREGRDASRGACVLLGAAGVALAMTRSLGPLWVAVVGAALLALAAANGDLRRPFRDRGVRTAGIAIAAGCLLDAIWVTAVDTLSNTGQFADEPLHEAIAHSLGRQFGMWHSIFAQFGYLDTLPPEGVHLVLAGCWLALGVVAMTVARHRIDRLVVLAVLAAGLLAGVAVEASQYNQLGPVWQGRYSLPLLAGVPMLSGWLIDRNRAALPSAASLRTWLIGLTTAAHAGALWFAIRRYAVGSNGKVWFFDTHSWLRWTLVPVTFGGLATVAALGVLTARAARAPETT